MRQVIGLLMVATVAGLPWSQGVPEPTLPLPQFQTVSEQSAPVEYVPMVVTFDGQQVLVVHNDGTATIHWSIVQKCAAQFSKSGTNEAATVCMLLMDVQAHRYK